MLKSMTNLSDLVDGVQLYDPVLGGWLRYEAPFLWLYLSREERGKAPAHVKFNLVACERWHHTANGLVREDKADAAEADESG